MGPMTRAGRHKRSNVLRESTNDYKHVQIQDNVEIWKHNSRLETFLKDFEIQCK